jgi:hypothetical protein
VGSWHSLMVNTRVRFPPRPFLGIRQAHKWPEKVMARKARWQMVMQDTAR